MNDQSFDTRSNLKVFFSNGWIKKDRGCILCYGRFNLELKKKILSDE